MRAPAAGDLETTAAFLSFCGFCRDTLAAIKTCSGEEMKK